MTSPVRLLLINPRFPESFWSFRWALDRVLCGKRTLNPPLGLATVAALCPPHWQVEIVDENVERVPLNPEADIIGICGMAVQYPRQRQLLEYYRTRGYYVVTGGSYASLCPERYHDLADTVVAGEAEYIWPQFCRDFERRAPRAFYQETGVVDLADSPVPRFELLRLDLYTAVSMQFSRGCPYRCEFCDIIVMFGRRPRTKSPAQIEEELERLRALDVRNVFFVDDNLIGHRPKAKALLRHIAAYQQQHRHQFLFGTEASLNVADDDQLLQAFRAANFGWLFIGIESPDEASLKETGKTQNMQRDMLGGVQKIYRHGIDVLAGFIIGFDNDTLESFERQHRFILASGIQVAMIGLLKALPRTPLYERLQREGRLIADADDADNTKPGTNLLPKRMDYDAMVQAYKVLYWRLSRDRDIAQRIRNKARHLGDPVYQGEYTRRQRLAIVARLLRRGVLPGGPLRWWRFARTLACCRPRAWPQVVADWTAGLAMRDYIERHFELDPAREKRLAQTTLAFVRSTFAGCLQRGDLEISLGLGKTMTRLAVTVRGMVDPRFYSHAGRRIDRLLRKTAATLSLQIDEFSDTQLRHLDRLLRRLSRHGDRVSLRLSHNLQALLTIDLSLFQVVLDPPGAAPSAGRQ